MLHIAALCDSRSPTGVLALSTFDPDPPPCGHDMAIMSTIMITVVRAAAGSACNHQSTQVGLDYTPSACLGSYVPGVPRMGPEQRYIGLNMHSFASIVCLNTDRCSGHIPHMQLNNKLEEIQLQTQAPIRRS
jgi:hypothetical protein